MHTPNTTSFARLIALVDPSSPEGERSLELARSIVAPGGSVHVAVPVSGASASAFEEFARSERVSPAQAAKAYGVQLARRWGPDEVTTTFLSDGDLTTELTALVARIGADAVVVPASMAAYAIATKRAWAALPYPVIVAAGVRAA